MSPAASEAVPRDLKMLRSPDLWPQWPILPLKRRQPPQGGAISKPELGFVCSIPGISPTDVFLGCIFDIPPSTNKLVYPSPEAILADGWVVD